MNHLLALLPIALICGFLPFEGAGMLSRALLLLSVSGELMRVRSLRRTEARWIGLLTLYLAVSATSATLSAEPSASMMDFGRQAFVVVFSVLLAISVRSTSARATLVRAMTIPAFFAMLAVLFFYWRFGSGVSEDALRTFKSSVSESAPAFAMNPLAGFVVLTFLLAIPAIFQFKLLTWISAATCALVLVLTGARSTLVALLVAVALFWMLKFLSKWSVLAQAAGLVLLLAICFVTTADVRMPAVALDKLDDVTTHRVFLWEAALVQFTGHPWFGVGADSWRLEMAAVLPAQSQDMFDRFSKLSSGAYHNAYLAFLAERGLVVFIPALLVLWFALRSAFSVYKHRNLLDSADRVFATLAPVLVLFIIVRQLAECSGLLGYANGGVDFASFAAASLVVALAGDIGHVASTAHAPQRIVRLRRATVVSWS